MEVTKGFTRELHKDLYKYLHKELHKYLQIFWGVEAKNIQRGNTCANGSYKTKCNLHKGVTKPPKGLNQQVAPRAKNQGGPLNHELGSIIPT